MYVSAHQENEKTNKREAGENNRWRGCLLLFCRRSGGSTAKNGLRMRSARGNWDPWEGQGSF